jgi:hypothetical protein
MEAVWNFFLQHVNYFTIGIVAIASFLVGLNSSIRKTMAQVWDTILTIVNFIANAIREPDSNGTGVGKTSISRIILAYTVIQIVQMAWVALYTPTAKIPAEMMTIFWVSGGLYMLIKVYNAASPQLQSLIDALMAKWNNIPTVPKQKTTTEVPPAQ